MDFLHKLSTEVCKNHARVYVERLNIRGMSASAKGTEEDPGRNVRAIGIEQIDPGPGMV